MPLATAELHPSIGQHDSKLAINCIAIRGNRYISWMAKADDGRNGEGIF